MNWQGKPPPTCAGPIDAGLREKVRLLNADLEMAAKAEEIRHLNVEDHVELMATGVESRGGAVV